jgi:hypothetical protein
MQNKKNKLWLYAACLFTLIFGSCQKQEIAKEENNISSPLNLAARPSNSEELPLQEGVNMELGEPKQNPYTVENMAAAWQDLMGRGIITNTEAHVYTSHYYVKFKPRNSDEYELLHRDSTLAFSDYPIESTIILNGDYYHDPSLPDSVPTYQYTAVKADYQFPEGIEYEILAKLYIPEADKIFSYEDGGTEDCFVDNLLNQAYKQTKNDEDIIDLTEYCGQQTTARPSYHPGGKIRVFDTRLQRYIGMEGVRVQARRWFTYRNAFPDYDGNYRMSGTFKRPCNYSIWFATSTFAVRHNLVNITFWINGPKITGDWNYDLNNSYQRFAGHVFRGAYRYHAKNIGGLQRPWLWPARQLYIAKDSYKSWSGQNWIVFPVIKIARYEDEKKVNTTLTKSSLPPATKQGTQAMYYE